ncbi:uncharacterized protein [Dermacentor andersoni]|uniref:uncharacterized protein n=1 Tax=Dermacentor andersoni TaxID=34620 RepID=UPI003B3AF126
MSAVHGFITGLLLLPAIMVFPQATAIPDIRPSTPGAGPLPAPVTTDSSCKTAPSLPSLDPHSPWNAPSSATSFPTSAIKPALSSPALCGLGGCASAQTTNPLYFAMQRLNEVGSWNRSEEDWTSLLQSHGNHTPRQVHLASTSRPSVGWRRPYGDTKGIRLRLHGGVSGLPSKPDR